MSFLDIFKKKKEEPKQGEPQKKERKKVEHPPLPEKKEEKKEEKKTLPIKPKEGIVKTSHKVLIAPQITEKATLLEEQGKYVFKVKQNTTKPEVKKAIEQVYNVKVVDVNIINSPKKKKRLGKNQGWKAGYKKALVSLAKGQSIELMPR